MNMNNLTPSSNSHPDSRTKIELDIAQERIRQARNTSNLALVATAIATGISIFGATAFFAGKVPEGTVTTAVGIVSSAHCIRLAKDANDRLDKLSETD